LNLPILLSGKVDNTKRDQLVSRLSTGPEPQIIDYEVSGLPGLDGRSKRFEPLDELVAGLEPF